MSGWQPTTGHTYHPQLNDQEALTHVRAALRFRVLCYEIVANWPQVMGRPWFGGAVPAKPDLYHFRFTTVGLTVLVGCLPSRVGMPWGNLNVAGSYSAKPSVTKAVIWQLQARGVVLEHMETTEYGDDLYRIQSVEDMTLPPAVAADRDIFHSRADAGEVFKAALAALQ